MWWENSSIQSQSSILFIHGLAFLEKIFLVDLDELSKKKIREMTWSWSFLSFCLLYAFDRNILTEKKRKNCVISSLL